MSALVGTQTLSVCCGLPASSAASILSSRLSWIQIDARVIIAVIRIVTAQTHLDAVRLVGGVDVTTLDLGMDLLRRLQKRLFDVVGRLGRRFQKQESVGIGKGLSFFGADGSTIFEIVLVADEEDDHVGLRVLLGLLEPPSEVLEGITTGDVVHQERARRTAVITPRDGSEGFLSGRIPDLQFDLRLVVFQGQET